MFHVHRLVQQCQAFCPVSFGENNATFQQELQQGRGRDPGLLTGSAGCGRETPQQNFCLGDIILVQGAYPLDVQVHGDNVARHPLVVYLDIQQRIIPRPVYR